MSIGKPVTTGNGSGREYSVERIGQGCADSRKPMRAWLRALSALGRERKSRADESQSCFRCGKPATRTDGLGVGACTPHASQLTQPRSASIFAYVEKKKAQR